MIIYNISCLSPYKWSILFVTFLFSSLAFLTSHQLEYRNCFSCFTSPPSWPAPWPCPLPSWGSWHRSWRKRSQSTLTCRRCAPLAPWKGCSSRCRCSPASCRRMGCTALDILMNFLWIWVLFYWYLQFYEIIFLL